MRYRAFYRMNISKEIEFNANNLDHAHQIARQKFNINLAKACDRRFCYVEKVNEPIMVANKVKQVEIFGVKVLFDFINKNINFDCEISEQIQEIQETAQYKEIYKEFNKYYNSINFGK